VNEEPGGTEREAPLLGSVWSPGAGWISFVLCEGLVWKRKGGSAGV